MSTDHVRRLVGIDFGTSTSLIRSKRYQGDQPIGDSYSVSAVTYGNGAGDSKALTLVRYNPNGTFTCGRYGEETLEGSTVYRDFKMDLEHPDLQKQNLARELTGEYFKYLYERYDHQKSDLGQLTDEVRTIISFPAKWKPETRDFMEAVAKNAGFPNVTSMDEPSAALYAVLCRKMDEISQQGLLSVGQSGYVLLVDMGAGTTDLAVCRYQIDETQDALIAADRIRTEIISTWPNHLSELTFGGREVDRILEDYLISYLCDCGFNAQMAQRAIRGVPGVKAWKEDTVSLLLQQDQMVNTCSTVSQYVMFAPQPKAFPAFGREEFQQMLGSKLDEFKELVTGCLYHSASQEPELLAKGIDLVVLTGGHSSWYFTSALLDGSMPGLEHPVLERVQREKNRVLRLSNPQETVALGMVYSQLPFQIASNNSAEEQKGNDGSMPEDWDAAESAAEPEDHFEVSSLADFLRSYRFESLLPVSEGSLPLLKQNLNIPPQETVYVGFDSTIFGSFKNGTVFTDQGIFCRGILASTVFCSWKELADGFLRFNGSTVLLHDRALHTEKTISSFYAGNTEIQKFYRLLQKYARREYQIPEQETPQSQSCDFSRVQFDQVVRNVLCTYDPAAIQTLIKWASPSSMRVNLRIPPEEILYLAHDDTLFKSGKNGTVLTSRGIYSRDIGETIHFTDWKTFAEGVLTAESYRVYLDLPTRNERRLIGLFTGVSAAALGLYMELQNAFRTAANS